MVAVLAVSMVDDVILESIAAHRALRRTSVVMTGGGSCRAARLCDVL